MIQLYIYIYFIYIYIYAQSCPTLCDTMDVTYQAPPSMGFSRQECWSGLPFPSPGDLPDPGIEPRSPALQADALPSEPPGKSYIYIYIYTFSDSFPLWVITNIEYSSLCYIVGPFWLSILYIVVCIKKVVLTDSCRLFHPRTVDSRIYILSVQKTFYRLDYNFDHKTSHDTFEITEIK